METTLIFSQIVFYFTVSLAIIIVAALFGIFIYLLIETAKEIRKVFKNINIVSNEIGEQTKNIINIVSNLPIFSYFFKKDKKRNKK